MDVFAALQCFMNSIIQCLSSTRPLLEYCLDEAYVDDINEQSSRMHGTMMKGFYFCNIAVVRHLYNVCNV